MRAKSACRAGVFLHLRRVLPRDRGHLRLACHLFAQRTLTQPYAPASRVPLKGWGIGFTYSRPGDYFMRLDLARRIGLANNASDDAKAKNRLWFMVGKVW